MPTKTKRICKELSDLRITIVQKIRSGWGGWDTIETLIEKKDENGVWHSISDLTPGLEEELYKRLKDHENDNG